MFEVEKIISKVPDYKEFMNLEELNSRAKEVSEKYGFDIKEIGRSEEKRSIYLIKAGTGSKKIFVWGFPHPNEPIGSLTIDFLLNQIGEKNLEGDFTWYFIYTADPDGTKLNEEWFKGELTTEKYFFNFFRPPGNRMIDWTFPVEYSDYSWEKPMQETKALMKFIDEVKPDLIYPLHNAGFGGAYFLLSEDLGKEFRDNIVRVTEELGIPLDFGEPEESFMKEIEKPFYYEFTAKDYYENSKKIGSKKGLFGDNSAGYLLRKNPKAIAIVSETPYFYDKRVLDQSESEKTRREVHEDLFDRFKENKDLVRDIIPRILKNLDKSDHYYYLMELFNEGLKGNNDEMREHIRKSEEYQRKATKAELFHCQAGVLFYGGGLYFGQIRRAALRAGLTEEAKILEKKIHKISDELNQISDWSLIPIRNMVKFQVSFLLEALNSKFNSKKLI